MRPPNQNPNELPSPLDVLLGSLDEVTPDDEDLAAEAEADGLSAADITDEDDELEDPESFSGPLEMRPESRDILPDHIESMDEDEESEGENPDITARPQSRHATF